MKKLVLIIVILIVLTSCGPAPTPVATPDLNATMNAISGTMVAGTLTAQPTNTQIPTNTSLPTSTFTPLPTETATIDPSLPTSTANPFDAAIPGAATPTIATGSSAQGNLNGLGTAILRVENLSGVKEIIVTIEGVTIPRFVPVWLSYKVTGALNFTIYEGTWQYKVEIPKKRFITGSFRQTNKDKTTMKVYLTKVVVLGP